MKDTGMICYLDGVGRIVIPKPIRSRLGLNCNDGVEVFVNGNQVVIQKYEPSCETTSKDLQSALDIIEKEHGIDIQVYISRAHNNRVFGECFGKKTGGVK
jgi:AbrB family looped-hinge helix DNA binding protein